ncbi:SulP family inorganic anion transporter [Chromobacterium piscinae]|uniref:SulP family inorganic anion transporter n=1 Tax=Chromobacterium piscinae TaxID=686831 RepID=UPI001E449B46|nr:SulP family inorganic anion transporter [Chromobacterium piscinae]MCD4505713.1 STAS domain-containing protein [Chromobacterium piscinae]MCD5328058.1 STAS domain-containing protein [Chromobacterium piscinae]
MSAIAFRPRLLETLRGYNRAMLHADLMAGVTVGIVALPLAMAFAIASGVPPQAGIFTAVIAGALAAALGGTRLCVTGPTGAFIVILYGIVSKYGVANLLICTFMAGAMLVLMGVFRLGQVIRFFPMPLITGFTNGIAVLIFLTQLKDFFGLPIAKMPSGFFAVMAELSRHFAGLHWPTTLLSSSLLLLILLWPKRLNRLLPSPFAALVLATLATMLLDLPVATLGSRFGGIPQGLPAPAGLDLNPAHLSDLLAPAFTIALLGAIESLLCAVVVDSLTADRHDANQELIGQGIANMVVPFFGGIPATGAVVRSVTNIGNGARTPLAAVFHAALLLLVLLLAAPLAAHVPLAALAAILVSVALKMGDWDIRKARQFPRHDTLVLVVTFALTVAFDLTVAVEIGLLLAAVFFIRSMASHTGIHRLLPEHAQLFERHSMAGKSVPDGCAAFRVEGALFFGAADSVDIILRDAPRARAVILQLHRLVLLDTTGLLALEALRARLAEQGKTLILCGAADEVMAMLEGSRLAERLGEDNLQPDLASALQRAEAVLTDGVVWA